MSEQIEQTDPKQAKELTPFDFLQKFTDAPTQADIESWKQQVPGRRLRLFHSSDGSRVYILRGLSGQELKKVQQGIPPATPETELQGEVQKRVASLCCVWTSQTQDHKLTPAILEASTAGLPQSLHEIVCQLSDYMDPVDIQRFSADL